MSKINLPTQGLRGNSPRTTRATGPTYEAGTCRPWLRVKEQLFLFFAGSFLFLFSGHRFSPPFCFGF